MNTILPVFAALGAAIALAPVPAARAQVIAGEPLGFNSVTCRPQSDTIVGVPFRPIGSLREFLASTPSQFYDPQNPGELIATLTLADSPTLTLNEFQDSHYVKFASGALDGRVFPIIGNTETALTIQLNGDSVSSALAGDKLIIAEYWTLETLFPAAAATTDATTTGHAILASPAYFLRYTDLLLPDLASPGTNLAPNQMFYIYDGAWRKMGEDPSADWGHQQLLPDAYFIIRHSGYVSESTKFKCSGEVELGNMAIQLSTQADQYQDNFIALPRPVDVTLGQLGLLPDAFVESSGSLSISMYRGDELLVFNNDLPAYNKSAAGIYYFYNGHWRANGAPADQSFDDTVIPAGTGFMIRKKPTPSGSTVFWQNSATYGNQP